MPFLVLGNKIDIPSAVSEETLLTYLNLKGTTTGKERTVRKDVRPLELFMCSVVQRFGYGEGFRWLAQNMK